MAANGMKEIWITKYFWLLCVLFIFSCDNGVARRDEVELGEKVLDTLGVTVYHERKHDGWKEKNNCNVYSIKDIVGTYKIEENYCFGVLESTTTYQNGKFYEEKICQVDSTLVLTFVEPCCYRIGLFVRNEYEKGDAKVLSGNDFFSFLDKERKIIVYMERKFFPDNLGEEKSFLCFYFWSIEKNELVKEFMIESDARMSKASFYGRGRESELVKAVLDSLELIVDTNDAYLSKRNIDVKY